MPSPSSFSVAVRPFLFYLLDYGIAALQKPKSEKKKKGPHYHFSPAFFSRL
jgi:hypothetical protein